MGASDEMLGIGGIYGMAGADIRTKPMEQVFTDAKAPGGGSITSFVPSTFDMEFLSRFPKLTSSQISYISTATGFDDIKYI